MQRAIERSQQNPPTHVLSRAEVLGDLVIDGCERGWADPSSGVGGNRKVSLASQSQPPPQMASPAGA